MGAVLLWLEAPLQSWGVSSRFGRRETLPFPTLSGVLGLLCCAMGRGGEQREFLARMKDSLRLVICYARRGRAGAGKGGPVPFVLDFQMVGSGYDTSDKWQDMNVPRKSDGSRPVGAGTKMTYRSYLQDTAFACVLDVPEEYLEEVVRGLKEPVWPVSLGRRSCVPSAPVFAGAYAGTDEAAEAGAARALEAGRAEAFRVVPGVVDGEVMTLNDVPVAFGIRKEYSDRMATLVPAAGTGDGVVTEE